MDGWLAGCVEGWMIGWVDGQIDEWTGSRTDTYLRPIYSSALGNADNM